MHSKASLTSRVEAASPLIAFAEITDDQAGRTARLSFDPRILAARAEAQGLPDPSASAAAASPRVQRMLCQELDAINATLAEDTRIERFVVALGGGTTSPPVSLDRLRPTGEVAPPGTRRRVDYQRPPSVVHR